MDGRLPVRIRRNQALPHTTTHPEQPSAWRTTIHVPCSFQLRDQCCSVSFHIGERAKAHLLHQQSDGRRKNQILKNGTNSLSLEVCRTEALPLFPSPSNNRAHQPSSQEYLAQT